MRYPRNSNRKHPGRPRAAALAAAAALLLSATGCIRNDIPFETIRGNILSMNVRGAESVEIDNSSRTVTLVLADTVDLRKVYLEDFKITADARIVDNVTGAELDTLQSYYLDFTQGGSSYAVPTDKPYTFTITTYQNYVWTIDVSQHIERIFTLSADQQIGESVFSVSSCSAVAYVPESVPLSEINVTRLQLGPSNAETDWVQNDGTVVENVDPATVHDFAIPQLFIVRYLDIEERWFVSVEYSTEYISSTSVNPWAKFAYLTAQGLTSAGDCSFQIRKSGAGDDAWRTVAAAVSNVTFTGTATGLDPSTAYEFRPVIGSYYGDAVAFTTEAAEDIPNLNFDTWTQSGKNWYPNSDASNSYWATGNEGVTIYTTANSTPVEGEGEAVSGKAARLETLGNVLLVDIAAGNLFTGIYKSNFSNPATSATMGRPYTSRPTHMTGWYKYSPGTVSTAGNRYSPTTHADAVGETDYCTIYIRLEDWGTATERPDNPTIIAEGRLLDNNVVSEYTQFDLKLQYNDLEATPTHVVICAASSRYGEDFCGGPGSVLYVDEFALGFDYDDE